MVRWVRAGAISAALAAMIVLSGVVLGRIYAGPLLLELVAGAAVGSVGVSLVARRLPNWVVAPLSAVLFAAYVIGALVVSAKHAGSTQPLLQTARDALVNGIPRLLTAMIPIEPEPDTIIVPVAAAWVAGLAGAEIAVRAGRVLLGLLPVTALYGGTLYVVGPNANEGGWPTLAFAGLAIAALAVSARPPQKTQLPALVRGRALAAALLALAVVVALVGGVGPWVGKSVHATPVDPRRYVQPPQVDSLDESPLNRISGWALSPKQPLFEVSTTGLPAKTHTLRLRLAVLPDYDGVTWRVGATYRNAGRVLPTPAPLPGSTVAEVHQTITIDELTGRLMPALPTPTAIDGTRVAYDAGTGTLISPDGLTAGVKYDVTSEVQNPDLNLLTSADSPSGDAVERFIRVGDNVPDEIQKLADQLAEGNSGPYDRASSIEDFLATHYRAVPDAPSGHAYPNLQFFLFGKRELGGQRGTSEQFAAAFALLARLTGLPSRVVVGFTLPATGGTVTAGDALAWPEVLFNGLGWVAFDPMPKNNQTPTPVEDDFTPKPPSPSPSNPASATPTASQSSSAPAKALAAAGGHGPSTIVIAGGTSGGVLFVLVLAAGLVVMARRSLRRRRLTAGGPDARITGAWSEFTDALRLAGRPVPAHLAATEAAEFAALPPAVPGGRRGPLLRAARPGRSGGSARQPDGNPQPTGTLHVDGALQPTGTLQLDGALQLDGSPRPDGELRSAVKSTADRTSQPERLPPLDRLVAGINTVGFAPGAADDDQARAAADQAVAYAAALRRDRSWWRRLWWSINPAPLRWNRR